MAVPEGDIRPEKVQFVAKLLFEKAQAGELSSEDFIKEQLRFLDRFVMEQLKAFPDLPPDERPISNTRDIPNSRGFFRVGFDNDEGNFGLKFVSGNWDSQSWCLSITVYDDPGSHRLHSVSILHQETRVLFRRPKKYDFIQSPKDLLPMSVEFSPVEPKLTAK